MKGDILPGELFDLSVDQPWFTRDFVRAPAFETVRGLFDKSDFEELLRQGVRLVDAESGKSHVCASGYALPMSFFIRDDIARFSNI